MKIYTVEYNLEQINKKKNEKGIVSSRLVGIYQYNK